MSLKEVLDVYKKYGVYVKENEQNNNYFSGFPKNNFYAELIKVDCKQDNSLTIAK